MKPVRELKFVASCWASLLIVSIFIGHSTMAAKPTPSEVTSDQVARVFDAVRAGDLSSLEALEKAGPALTPWLKPYVVDANENVRRETVSLLSVIGGEAAIPLLATALTDSSAEVSERAAFAFYEHFDPDDVVANGEAAKSILTSINAGRPVAATLVLAGYIQREATQAALRKFIESPESDYLTSLRSDASPVSARLAAHLALARLGDRQAMSMIAHSIENADVDQWLFLLGAVRDINAPRILHALKSALDDERETSAGIPSHAAPKRRICDEAVNALVERLELKTSFSLSTTARYTQQQRAEVRRLIDELLPK
jgi:HEAT repeat protein